MTEEQVEYRYVEDASYYCVGTNGLVFSKRQSKNEWRELNQQLNNRGYLEVKITYDNGYVATRKVHQLVLEAFVGPCPEYMEVCHINGIKTDNRLSNLTYGTKSENFKTRLIGTKGEKHGMSILTEKDVLEIRRLGEETDLTQKEIGDLFGVDRGTVSKIICRTTWKHI